MSSDDIDFSMLVGSHVPTQSFKAGDTIFKEGDPATELYVIQKGRGEFRPVIASLIPSKPKRFSARWR